VYLSTNGLVNITSLAAVATNIAPCAAVTTEVPDTSLHQSPVVAESVPTAVQCPCNDGQVAYITNAESPAENENLSPVVVTIDTQQSLLNSSFAGDSEQVTSTDQQSVTVADQHSSREELCMDFAVLASSFSADELSRPASECDRPLLTVEPPVASDLEHICLSNGLFPTSPCQVTEESDACNGPTQVYVGQSIQLTPTIRDLLVAGSSDATNPNVLAIKHEDIAAGISSGNSRSNHVNSKQNKETTDCMQIRSAKRASSEHNVSSEAKKQKVSRNPSEAQLSVKSTRRAQVGHAQSATPLHAGTSSVVQGLKPSGKVTTANVCKRPAAESKEQPSSSKRLTLLPDAQSADQYWRADPGRYECPNCPDVFPKPAAFLYHLQHVHKVEVLDNKLLCVVCTLKFENETEFSLHERVAHNIGSRAAKPAAAASRLSPELTSRNGKQPDTPRPIVTSVNVGTKKCSPSVTDSAPSSVQQQLTHAPRSATRRTATKDDLLPKSGASLLHKFKAPLHESAAKVNGSSGTSNQAKARCTSRCY
jgi:hypothetical protein